MNNAQYIELIGRALENYMPEVEKGASPTVGEIPELLTSAMRYSLMQGGKRIRPVMLLAAVDMLGGNIDAALPYACAVEMIHTYSLIHDDLPGMDDDDIRRGLPTNHKVYGEGQAILAGDGLLSLAFEVMYQAALGHKDDLLSHVQAASEIARGAGARGMVAGQSLDLMLEHRPTSSQHELQFIQNCKTGALFIYALRAAGRLCGADEDKLKALTDYGRAFGILFQTVDDLLDEQGDEAQIGKKVGKDRESGKLTAVSVYGVGGALELRSTYLEDAHNALAPFGDGAQYFHDLVDAAASREK